MSFTHTNIRKAREQLGFSQEDLMVEFRRLSKAISTQTIHNWENGITKPKADDLSTLCTIFRKPVSYFFAQ